MSGAPILIAGAGIAGLTAALALARHNIPSRLYERETEFSAIGAGVQLSPNATRLLEKLGALDFMLEASIQPRAVIIKDAVSLAELARVPLGAFGERRWRAPYLVVHRADLQQALLNAADRSQHIEIVTGARIRAARARPDGVSLLVEQNERGTEVKGLLAIGADGVWSDLRAGINGTLTARFSGEIAWRATLPATSEMGKALGLLASPDMVTTFIHPRFHLVCYPINTGRAFNLVAVTGGLKIAQGWTRQGDVSALESAMAGIAEPLAILMRGAAPWTVWPLHEVSPKSAWSQNGRLMLIGDAAHAMTPFAAQGAAMAIEDAAVLASCISAHRSDLGSAVAAFETARRPRLRKVAARGRFNRFAWHARWPISMARNFVLARRDPERLAADLDWLYGWQPESL